MALANYTDLQTAIANHLHRSDLASVIPDLITLANLKIFGTLNSRKQDTIVTLTTVAAQENLAVPADFMNVRAFVFSATGNPIDYKAPDAMIREFAAGAKNEPRFYTIIGDNFYFAPVPDAAYAMRLVYQAKVPDLTAGAPTNWLMTAYPAVYLYAALVCAAPYLKDDNRIQVWETMFDSAINSVNVQDWNNAATITVRGDITL